jgi:hypothetical protein
MNNKNDKIIALIIWILNIAFILLMFNNQYFFDWAFDRHHNQWSWYLRPIFLIPFCITSFKQSHTGMALTVFCLLTSMFWFPKPESVNDQVIQFLKFEKEYLLGEWKAEKIATLSTVPISFILLALAFWKRSIKAGVIVLFFIALSKIIWSITEAGEAGRSILIPAIGGLAICAGIILLIFRKRK